MRKETYVEDGTERYVVGCNADVGQARVSSKSCAESRGPLYWYSEPFHMVSAINLLSAIVV